MPRRAHHRDRAAGEGARSAGGLRPVARAPHRGRAAGLCRERRHDHHEHGRGQPACRGRGCCRISRARMDCRGLADGDGDRRRRARPGTRWRFRDCRDRASRCASSAIVLSPPTPTSAPSRSSLRWRRSADIVITGRAADPSLFVAPLAFEFGWSADDWPALGRGTLVGHLLECAGQVTGGYFADPGCKDVAGLARLGFPIADVPARGRSSSPRWPGRAGA